MKRHSIIADRLTRERLSSYLTACSGDIEAAIALYDWNSRVAGALHEDIGRFEVVFRNSIDAALRTYGQAARLADRVVRPLSALSWWG
ncbi:hypothetical protein [Ilumatobacter sp.]|uniref:hypothetical protein n=1 Tax=Ilumatobacter sp. TaxID=1967498 RepID=UPI0037509E60